MVNRVTAKRYGALLLSNGAYKDWELQYVSLETEEVKISTFLPAHRVLATYIKHHIPRAADKAPLLAPNNYISETDSRCPPGLQYLTQIDELIVQGEVDFTEALSAFHYNNIYGVKNSLGQVVFYVVEDSDCCSRFCCGSQRSFLLRVINNHGEEVIRISRPLNCCLQELEVQCPPGNPIGSVTQELHPFLPKFMIRNEMDEPVLKLTGPFCICGCDTDFEVKSLNEAIVVGRITKHWAGLAQELLTNANNFAVHFPLDLDVRVKAVVLGACFLIDFMYYKN